MPQTQFAQQLQAYDQWKTRLIRTIEEARPWLAKHGISNPDSEVRIQRTLDTLRSDRLTIAFVAEFSRGKTELINALFFADHGRRLLPSTAGRTTMCPTEIFYDDEADEAYIRLLPIETRADEATVSELRATPGHWVHYPLQVDASQQMEHTLKEVVRTKRVSIDEARRLDLYQESLCVSHPASGSASEIDIPKWRHALISFPHPLLKQGLTILDTPGLNALGSEPELTLNLLPDAQAVLFVLSADAGVTGSDLEVWRTHIRSSRSTGHSGLTVALNKIDVLWDELLDASDVDRVVQQQRIATAGILGVGADTVFPVSAQKGLLARIRNDGALLEKSALPDLETHLSRRILGCKREIIQDVVASDVGYLLENTSRIVNRKRLQLKKHMEELEQLEGKSEDVRRRMFQQARDEHASCMRNVDAFERSRMELGLQARFLREALDPDGFDHLVKSCHHRMSLRWTTYGLRKSMKNLFDTLQANFQTVVEYRERTHRLTNEIYLRFQEEHAFTVASPRTFSIKQYQTDLELLGREAETFRNSPLTAMTEQGTLIKRFFLLLVGRARKIFSQVQQDAEAWFDSALSPLALEIQNHKEMTEDKLQNLKRLGRSKKTLETRIHELRASYDAATQLLPVLEDIRNRLHETASPLPEAPRGGESEKHAASSVGCRGWH